MNNFKGLPALKGKFAFVFVSATAFVLVACEGNDGLPGRSCWSERKDGVLYLVCDGKREIIREAPPNGNGNDNDCNGVANCNGAGVGNTGNGVGTGTGTGNGTGTGTGNGTGTGTGGTFSGSVWACGFDGQNLDLAQKTDQIFVMNLSDAQLQGFNCGQVPQSSPIQANTICFVSAGPTTVRLSLSQVASWAVEGEPANPPVNTTGGWWVTAQSTRFVLCVSGTAGGTVTLSDP